jgi:hypothetical protein
MGKHSEELKGLLIKISGSATDLQFSIVVGKGKNRKKTASRLI